MSLVRSNSEIYSSLVYEENTSEGNWTEHHCCRLKHLIQNLQNCQSTSLFSTKQKMFERKSRQMSNMNGKAGKQMILSKCNNRLPMWCAWLSFLTIAWLGPGLNPGQGMDKKRQKQKSYDTTIYSAIQSRINAKTNGTWYLKTMLVFIGRPTSVPLISLHSWKTACTRSWQGEWSQESIMQEDNCSGCSSGVHIITVLSQAFSCDTHDTCCTHLSIYTSVRPPVWNHFRWFEEHDSQF